MIAPTGHFRSAAGMDDVDFWMSCHIYMMSIFVMLFCELDGGLRPSGSLWRCIRGWESYQTARKNEGKLGGNICRWSSQNLDFCDTKRNRALRKNKIDIRNRFLGSVGWVRVRLGVRKR